MSLFNPSSNFLVEGERNSKAQLGGVVQKTPRLRSMRFSFRLAMRSSEDVLSVMLFRIAHECPAAGTAHVLLNWNAENHHQRCARYRMPIYRSGMQMEGTVNDLGDHVGWGIQNVPVGGI